MFTDKECKILVMLISAEILKAELHYGHNHKYVKYLYSIRDKLLEGNKDGK